MKRNSVGIAWQSFWLSNLLVSSILLFNLDRAIAQVIPDNTLGNESSVVNPRDETSDRIDGGAIRGQNLFHSFQEFNVDAGKGVYFNNPEAINNIFSRVTGNNVSNILGTLGVDGAANLFLINPNGIIFGEGASLDVQGSFVATTANGIEFGEQGSFDATNPQVPQLLTINPSAYLFNQIEDRAINGIESRQSFLNVPEGENLIFLGRDINLIGSTLTAPGGRIELGGLQGIGEVGISSDGSLAFPDNVIKGDISLSSGAFVDVTSAGSGFININARNLGIFTKSAIFAGIGAGLGNSDAVAGDITLNVTEKLSLDDSFIANLLFGEGKTGDIFVTTSFLEIINGAQLGATTFGRGDGGSVTITAGDLIVFDGQSSDGNASGVLSSVNPGAEGNAGDISITTSSLAVTNGAQINSSTSSRGDGGSITITASDSVVFDGESINGTISGASSSVNQKQ